MKPMLLIGTLVLIAGLWMEYQKDSSFASVDSGSLFIGGGLGLLTGHML
jgi:hypothetical protein